MSIFDDIEDGFKEIGNAVTGAANTVADGVSDTAVSFGESVASYAIVVGDGVASAGTTIGDGVVTFGNDVAKFSVDASGTAFNWMQTSAYDVGDWVENAAGDVADFSKDAFDKAKIGLEAVWNLLKDLFASTLPTLDEPSLLADQLATFILAAAKFGYEALAKEADMTIGFVITAKAGVLFGISYPLGLYVDDNGQWGLVKLTSWEQFKSLQTASISLDAGISLTVENIYVFGSRQDFSGRRYFDLGGKVSFGAFAIGGSVMIDADNFDFVGFKLSGSVGLDLKPTPNAGNNQPKTDATFSLNGQAINVSELGRYVGQSGSVYDAAVMAVRDPGSSARIASTALAAKMLPFTPRFYGRMRGLDYAGRPMAIGGFGILLVEGPGIYSAAAPFRIVAGLADPKAISIEVQLSDGIPRYLRADPGGAVVPDYPFSNDDTVFFAQATFVLEQGLADKSGVSIRTREATPRYFNINMVTSGWFAGIEIMSAAANDKTDRFARQATFHLDTVPMPPQETATVADGEPFAIGEYRRSPDGRYYMVRESADLLRLGIGPKPSYARPAPPLGSPGTGYTWNVTDPNNPNRSMLFGNPGALFTAVTDGGRIAAVQGTPTNPGEVVLTSNQAVIRWATSRQSVALRASNGKLVRVAPEVATNGQGRLYADSNKLSSCETFELLTHSDGSYSLRAATGWYVWAENGAVANLETANTGTAFRQESQSGGQVSLRSTDGNKLVCVTSSGILDATGVAGNANTFFTIIPLARNLAAEVGRAFRFVNKKSKLCLTVKDHNQAENAILMQMSATGGRNQSFTLVPKSNGLYSLAAQHSGKVFDFGTTAANAPLVQHSAHTGASQQYSFLPNVDGTYAILSSMTGFAITVQNASSSDGAAIVLAPYDANNEAQRFFVEAEETLVNRALVVQPDKSTAPLRVRYQERAGQSTWLDGWLDSIDAQLVGDFLGIGRAQVCFINRSWQGGRVMVADFGATNDTGTAQTLYFEPYGETGWLNGWTDDNDWQLAGDFKNLGKSQILFINRGGTGGRGMIMEVSEGGYLCHYVEMWGGSALFNGWQDDTDRWLVGDFMGRGYDQVLCINRGGAGGKVMIVDFSGTTPQVLYWENWGQYAWLDANLYLTNQMCHLVGDFMGLGYAQLFVVDPVSRSALICDFKSGTPVIRANHQAANLVGWLDGTDVQIAGDFMGLGRAQILVVNRNPTTGAGKLTILDPTVAGYPGLYLETWAQRTCLDGMLEPTDRLVAGDFMGDGRKLAQLLVLAPNIKSAPHPALLPQTGSTAASIGLSIRVRLSNGGGEVLVPPGAAAYRSGSTIEGFTVELSPPIPGLGIEYMAWITSQGPTAWTSGGTYCGSTVTGRSVEAIAMRLTGTYKDHYTLKYGANGAPATNGATAGTPGTALTSMRVGGARLGPTGSKFGTTSIGANTTSPPQAYVAFATPVAMPASPVVIATTQGGDYNDTFAYSLRETNSNLIAGNVRRRDDITAGWGQNLQLGWLGCPILNRPNLKTGVAPIGAHTATDQIMKVVTVTFATPFARVPKVIATAHGWHAPDCFAVTVRSVSTTGFTLNVYRVDDYRTWGQPLQLDYVAWDDDNALRTLGASQFAAGITTIDANSAASLKRTLIGYNRSNQFAGSPTILLTPLAEDKNEAFDATATKIGRSSFTANVVRTDSQAGWTQDLRLTYLALF